MKRLYLFQVELGYPNDVQANICDLALSRTPRQCDLEGFNRSVRPEAACGQVHTGIK